MRVLIALSAIVLTGGSVAAAAVAGASSTRVPTFGVSPRDAFSYTQDLQPPLRPGHPVRETLDPVGNGLSEVGVYFRAVDRQGIDAPEMAPPVHLRVVAGSYELRRADVSHPSGGELRFHFTPIPDSGRSRLAVDVSVNRDSDIQVQLFAVRSGDASRLPLRLRYWTGQPAAYQAAAALDRASQYRPGPLKGIVLLAILAAAITVLLMFAAVLGLALEEPVDSSSTSSPTGISHGEVGTGV